MMSQLLIGVVIIVNLILVGLVIYAFAKICSERRIKKDVEKNKRNDG